jgi:hypothetical protein
VGRWNRDRTPSARRGGKFIGSPVFEVAPVTTDKNRRRDPLATDSGTWTIMGTGAPAGQMTLDEIEAFFIEQQMPGGIEEMPKEFADPLRIDYEEDDA